MRSRGVTRNEMKAHADVGASGRGMADGMGADDPRLMLEAHHRRTLWAYWLLVLLGFWLIAFPLTFAPAAAAVEPAGGRGVWLSLEGRIAALRWSDLLSGLLLVVFGWRSLRPNRPVSLWICAGVGVWLTFAPLVFWAPTAAIYLNDTTVGALVIALAVLIPGMPNMMLHMRQGPEVPPGWSYNPSSWPQRGVMIGLAFLGWLVSRYLAAYQLGYIDQAWDPFFGAGTVRVLESDMSESWPISDAAFGAVAYTFEFLMGWMGGRARWRTMPWMVLFFGILVIPLGLVHIFLVISQPVTVGAWCTLCLTAAAIMLPMIPLAADEVVAMGQFLADVRRRGGSLWRAFWLGGTMEGGGEDERTPEMVELPERPLAVAGASVWGMAFPWTLIASAVAGLGLVLAPALLDTGGRAADALQVGGLLALTVAVVSMGEVMRAFRWLNVPLGVAVASVPWLLDGVPVTAAAAGAILGLSVAALALPRGRIHETYGSWDRLIR